MGNRSKAAHFTYGVRRRGTVSRCVECGKTVRLDEAKIVVPHKCVGYRQYAHVRHAIQDLRS